MIDPRTPIQTPPANDDGRDQGPGWSWNPVGTKRRIELLKLWDAMSDDGKRFVLTMARAKAEEDTARRGR